MSNNKYFSPADQKRRVHYSRIIAALIALAILVVSAIFVVNSISGISKSKIDNTDAVNKAETLVETTTVETEPIADYAKVTDSTITLTDQIHSEACVLIDLETGNVIAQKNADEKLYPASLTKIMTCIVAIENIKDFNATYTFSEDILYNLNAQNASMANFQAGETVKLIDMLYGAMLPSGADATTGLALTVSGSEEGFVALMNQKAKELGISNTTHFADTSGLHNDQHYTTANDIAVILRYALKNDLFYKVFTSNYYTTSATQQNPNGLLFSSTLFSKIYGNDVPGVLILGGKTGFTDEAGQCLASLAQKDRHQYICVTMKATPNDGGYANPHIIDAFSIYGTYLGGGNTNTVSETTTPQGTTINTDTTDSSDNSDE